MTTISFIKGREILDSRGLPALEIELTLNQQVRVRVSVPSGASTGAYEAWELRDKDPKRFHGKGLLKAISHIKTLSQELKNKNLSHQEELDNFLKSRDGTANKSFLGANVLMAISLAYAKAKAKLKNQELFESFGNKHYVMPVPLINILNGGAHANNNLNVQEFMIVPHGFSTFKSALQAGAEVFYCLKNLLKQQNLSVAVGDEGGFAPLLSHNEEGIKLLLRAIEQAGYSPETQIGVALDVAASELYKNNKYLWQINRPLRFVNSYPDFW